MKELDIDLTTAAQTLRIAETCEENRPASPELCYAAASRNFSLTMNAAQMAELELLTHSNGGQQNGFNVPSNIARV